MTLDQALDELYGVPLAEFTKTRDRLAKDHPQLKGLRRPTATAWAVNQLARREKARMTALVEAGAHLAKVQTAALRGDSSADQLRDAGRKLAALVDELGDRAQDILTEGGHRATLDTRRTIGLTLRAGATNDEQRLVQGRIERDLEPTDPFQQVIELPAKKKQAIERERKREREEEAVRQKAIADLERKLERAREKVREAQEEVERLSAELARQRS